MSAASQLKDMLAQGWKVAGFQQTTAMSAETDGPETDGFYLLLQKDSDLAVCWAAHSGDSIAVTSINILTEAA
ncbi:MAG: hypothetical protein WDN01_08290 [Rhizomicrobium sp.]